MLSSNQRLSRRALVDRRLRRPRHFTTKSPTAVKNGGSPRWQSNETALLRVCIGNCYGATRVALTLGRSRSAVCAKARRLRLKWCSTTPQLQAQALNRKRKAKRGATA